ncbi:Vesicle-associated membrane protein 4 [Chamberlinius hualienensis]
MPPKFRRNEFSDDIGAADDDERSELLKGQSDDDDDDFFLSGPPKTRGVRTDGKITETQSQIRQVQGIMKENIVKIMERGDKLEDLEDRSYTLTTSADQFSSSAKRLRRTMWWNDTKMKLILALVIFVILLLIFIPVIVRQVQK